MPKTIPVTVYEEFGSAKDKRAASKQRGKPTGKGIGFVFTFPGQTFVVNRGCGRASELMHDAYVAGRDGSYSTSVSDGYLRENCRRVGGKHLTGKWRKEYDYIRSAE